MKHISKNNYMQALQETTALDFIPWDLQVARINFKANCGPVSFATITRKEVCRIMRHFIHFERFQGTNLTQMRAAFLEAGFQANVKKQAFPEHGVALIQFLGPWTEKHFFSHWSLIHTHWVAVHHGWIFDHTAANWLPSSDWDRDVANEFVAKIPHATGWAVKYGIEVSKSNSN